MQSHNARTLAIAAGSLFLIAVFVVWRAQDFHYCVQPGAREQKSRFAASADVCAPNEQPMAWRQLWQVDGGAAKIKMLGTTTAEAFGLDSVAKKP